MRSLLLERLVGGLDLNDPGDEPDKDALARRGLKEGFHMQVRSDLCRRGVVLQRQILKQQQRQSWRQIMQAR